LIYQWNQDGTVLTIYPGAGIFMDGTNFEVILSRQISDINGNQMDSDFQLTFTTRPQTIHPDPPGPEFVFPYWILGLIALIAIVLISLFLLIRRRGDDEEPKTEPPVEFGQAPPIDQSIPPTYRPQFQSAREITSAQTPPAPPLAPLPTGPRVTCPRCQNPFSIEVSSVPYRMHCPHCGAKGKVERA
jgi:hypothetical protein